MAAEAEAEVLEEVGAAVAEEEEAGTAAVVVVAEDEDEAAAEGTSGTDTEGLDWK